MAGNVKPKSFRQTRSLIRVDRSHWLSEALTRLSSCGAVPVVGKMPHWAAAFVLQLSALLVWLVPGGEAVLDDRTLRAVSGPVVCGAFGCQTPPSGVRMGPKTP